MPRRPALSTSDRVRLFAAHGGLCHRCGAKIDGSRQDWDIDEVPVPRRIGAAEDPDASRRPAHTGACP